MQPLHVFSMHYHGLSSSELRFIGSHPALRLLGLSQIRKCQLATTKWWVGKRDESPVCRFWHSPAFRVWPEARYKMSNMVFGANAESQRVAEQSQRIPERSFTSTLFAPGWESRAQNSRCWAIKRLSELFLNPACILKSSLHASVYPPTIPPHCRKHRKLKMPNLLYDRTSNTVECYFISSCFLKSAYEIFNLKPFGALNRGRNATENASRLRCLYLGRDVSNPLEHKNSLTGIKKHVCTKKQSEHRILKECCFLNRLLKPLMSRLKISQRWHGIGTWDKYMNNSFLPGLLFTMIIAELNRLCCWLRFFAYPHNKQKFGVLICI